MCAQHVRGGHLRARWRGRDQTHGGSSSPGKAALEGQGPTTQGLQDPHERLRWKGRDQPHRGSRSPGEAALEGQGPTTRGLRDPHERLRCRGRDQPHRGSRSPGEAALEGRGPTTRGLQLTRRGRAGGAGTNHAGAPGSPRAAGLTLSAEENTKAGA